MARQELEAALRRQGEEKAREIWRSAERSARQLRDETGAKLRESRDKSRLRQEGEASRLVDDAGASARFRARLQRLAVEQRLVDRLRGLAATLLPQLAEAGGEQLFGALAAELPEFDWSLVKVNRRDAGPARDRFKTAEISIDEGISGGLEAQDDEGRLVVTNTLEKRLEQLWPELLPVMLKELRKRIDDDGTAANNTA